MFQIFSFLNGPLGWIIRICYNLVKNYAVALLLFAIVMQIILLPLGIKQQKNSVKQEWRFWRWILGVMAIP